MGLLVSDGQVIFTCDGDHVAGTAPRLVVDDWRWYPDAHARAMKAGWKETHRKGDRVFLGPCCSGKTACR